jgi:hypothetical protein
MDCPDNYFVTLFSDMNQEYFKNSTTSFTNLLPVTLDATEGQFEIGLKEVRFLSHPAPTSFLQAEKVSTVQPIENLKGPLVGPQPINLWVKSKAIFNFSSKSHIKGYTNFISAVNLFLETTELKFEIDMFILSDIELLIKFSLDVGSDHWLEIPEFFATMTGLDSTRIPNGKSQGKPVPFSIYETLGEPQELKILLCHIYLDKELMNPSKEFGFEPFLNEWANALERSSERFGSEFGLLHEYIDDNVFLEVICYDKEESMMVSFGMNRLMNLPDNYVFKGETNLIIPLKNFEPIIPPPTPPIPIVIDPEKFVYILCNVCEVQAIGGKHVPALTVLPREDGLKTVSKIFDSVFYTPLIRQLVRSIDIKITNRNLVCLPSADKDFPSYCVLHIRRSQ